MASLLTYYSVGGGFVVEQTDLDVIRIVPEASPIRYPFENAEQLLGLCELTGLSVSQLMLANEGNWRSEQATFSGLEKIWRAMLDCVSRGCRAAGLMGFYPAGWVCKGERLHSTNI